jgi:diacylglycerol kinase family enzyme
LLLNGTLPKATTRLFQTETLTLTSSSATPLQIDGELIGHLPATFRVERGKLRVIAP